MDSGHHGGTHSILSHFIPPIHGIDGLGWLCAASFVDTASVDPQPLIFILLSPLVKGLSVATVLTNLISLLHGHLRELNDLTVVHFLPGPPVGQDRILSRFVIAELEDFGATIHSLSLSNQLLTLKKAFSLISVHTSS
ncbi:hypothetical protein SCLCIDRAFT_1209730, partial [Scleroderma citrinum Foug A]